MDWQFNGWGGLYGTWEFDKLVARKICEAERLPYVSTDFVLEGGSIHVDGEGWVHGCCPHSLILAGQRAY